MRFIHGTLPAPTLISLGRLSHRLLAQGAAPNLHHSLEEARRHILIGVAELMLSAEQPWKELPEVEALSRSILERDFGRLYGPLVPTVSAGEIARLIGECPIGWKQPEA